MRLTTATLPSARPGTTVPGYERAAVRPGIVHIGMGNFHRSHQAVYLDRLLETDVDARDFGLVGVNLLAQDEALARTMADQDRLYTVLERHEDGSTRARIIGSILDSLWSEDGSEPVLEALVAPTTRIVTLTITEGGYCQDPATGAVDLSDPRLRADLEHPGQPVSAFGYLAEALRRRRAAGAPPFTVLSCDNVIGNGSVAREVLVALATEIDPDLGEWIAANVTFPSSMVDRITPRTQPHDLADAEDITGLRDDIPVACEAFTQWVVEDRFVAGRPSWEAVGVQMVDDVRPFELMKLRLLNSGHLAISYAGALLGHEFGWQACTDPTVRGLLEHYLRHEGTPAVGSVPGVDLEAYCATVVARFANPQIKDTMRRLRSQSTTSLATFLLPVARVLVDAGHELRAIPTILACWTHLVQERRDDKGQPIDFDDIRSTELLERAEDRADPLALIRGNPLFVGLDDHPLFVQPYARTLEDIRRNGVRSAVAAALGPRPADPAQAGGRTTSSSVVN